MVVLGHFGQSVSVNILREIWLNVCKLKGFGPKIMLGLSWLCLSIFGPGCKLVWACHVSGLVSL